MGGGGGCREQAKECRSRKEVDAAASRYIRRRFFLDEVDLLCFRDCLVSRESADADADADDNDDDEEEEEEVDAEEDDEQEDREKRLDRYRTEAGRKRFDDL